MEEFISLSDDPTRDPAASEPGASESEGIIDLEQAQVDAADEAVNLNLNAPPEMETLPSQHQPQDTVNSTVKASTSTSSAVEIIDLEEGQVAGQQVGAQDAQGAAAAAAADNPHQAKAEEEALGANGVEPPPPSQQQPQDGACTKAAAPDDIIDLEEGQVEDMDLSDDNAVVVVTKRAVSAAETPKGSDGLEAAPLSRPGSAFIDESRIL